MALLLLFGVAMLAAILVSELSERSVLSTAVLFLTVGFVAGGVTNVVSIGSDNDMLGWFARVALFAVLFTDGMRVGARQLISAWRLPGRALLFGLPLTLVITGALAHLVAGLPWAHALLVGAVLSPTDPVFASALIGREGVPRRLSHLLNVESGLNDGLALPIVVVLLAFAGRDSVDVASLAGELLLRVTVGIVVPLVAIRLEESPLFASSSAYEPLFPFSIGVVIFAAAELTHANLFLAAFSAGIVVATVSPRFTEAFHRFGELLTELLKLGSVLLFGALISPSFLAEVSLSGYVFAALALLLARPLSLLVSFLGANIDPIEWAAAAWFGPKGFASVVYGILIVEAGVARADELFHLIAIVIAASILLHSSTDVAIARKFRSTELERARTR